MRKTLLAAILALTGASCLASDYYLVMPVKGKTINASAIQMSLAPASAPDGQVDQAYHYDLAPLLAVSGDPGFTGYGVAWAVDQGTLPTGLALDPKSGVVSGTAAAASTSAVTISATYKSKSAQQAYTILVRPRPDIGQFSGYLAWADGTLAQSCKEYRYPADGHSYAGVTGSGTYRIRPAGGATADVYCDMTTDGGGWTLVRRIAANSGAWAPVTDNAMGTAPAYGTYVADPNAASSFSMFYSNVPFTDFRFATGDGAKWVIMAKSVLAQATGACTVRVPVKASHTSATPYTVAMCLRYGSATPEDPWVSADDHNSGGTTASADNDTYSMLYGENSVNLWPTWRTKRGGANVFVR
jgi:hypothetical protein